MSDLIAANLEIAAAEFDTPAIDAIGMDAADFSIAVAAYAAISIPEIEISSPELNARPQLTIPAAGTGARRGHAILVTELLHKRAAVAHLPETPDQVFAIAIAGTAPERRAPLRAAFAVSHVVDHQDDAQFIAVAGVDDRLREAA